jgi:PAS domain S-box-containing protein
MASLDGSLVYLNEAGRRLVGLESLEEALSKQIADFFGEEQLRHWREVEEPSLHKDGRWEGESSVRHFRTGEEIPVAASSFVISDPASGEPVRLASVRRDIRERKRIEQELERRVDERTVDLDLARSEAERANRTKSEFLSRMSHELRTPLNAVLGFAQLLELDAAEEREREYIEHILRGGHHLLNLVNDALDIAQVEARELSLSLDPVHVGDLLQEALALVGPLALDVDVALPQGLPGGADQHVLADRQRLLQILLNLLSNAIKYNRPGGRVDVSCTRGRSGRVRVDVHDTGPGLTPTELERIFEPFERLGRERGDVPGTGLGLSVTKTLVEAMGGAISASPADEGTIFSVDLVGAAPQVGTAPDGPADPDRATAAELSVLYVEDNPTNVALVAGALGRRPSVHLRVVQRGRAGLAAAAEERPQLILLDLHLPDMSGRELLNELRNDPKTREIPVIIVSADANPDQIEQLVAAGAHAYLTKPIDVRQLLRLVDDLGARKPS